nr:hypothetical protein [Burkholderia ubonensis]
MEVVPAGVAGAIVPDVADRPYSDGVTGVEDESIGAVVGGTAGTTVHPLAMDGADGCAVALATAGCGVVPARAVAPAPGEFVNVDQAGAAGEANDGVMAGSIATEEGRPAPSFADFAARSVSSRPAVIAAAGAASAAGSMADASSVATGVGAAVVATDAKASGSAMDSACDASAIDGAMTFAVDAGVTVLASTAADIGSGAVWAASDDTSPSGGTADADASAAGLAAMFVATPGMSFVMPAGMDVSAPDASALRVTAAVPTKTAGAASIADCAALANSAG